MVDKVIGAKNVWVVSGNCGNEYNEELKRLKKLLKAEGRRIEAKIVTKAIIFTEEVK